MTERSEERKLLIERLKILDQYYLREKKVPVSLNSAKRIGEI